MVEQRLGVFVEDPFQENSYLCSHKSGSCNPNSPCGLGVGVGVGSLILMLLLLSHFSRVRLCATP